MDKMRTERLAGAVAALQTELNRADREQAAELRVGGAEDLQVLRLLASAGALRVGEIARRRSVSLTTASGRLDRLERKGLIVRERRADDKRAMVALLTETGAAAAGASIDERMSILTPLSRRFPVSDLEDLVHALAGENDSADEPAVGSGDLSAGDASGGRRGGGS